MAFFALLENYPGEVRWAECGVLCVRFVQVGTSRVFIDALVALVSFNPATRKCEMIY